MSAPLSVSGTGSSGVEGLVDSIRQHKNFKRLAGYAIQCLEKVSCLHVWRGGTDAPPRRKGQGVHWRSASPAQAPTLRVSADGCDPAAAAPACTAVPNDLQGGGAPFAA